jgi:hypothetical protein
MTDKVKKIVKDKEYTVNQIVAFLELKKNNHFFLKRKYKGQTFTESIWKLNYIT